MALTEMVGTWLGPLTTAWAMPDGCKVHLANCATCDEGFRGQQCVTDGVKTDVVQDHTSCWPPARSQAGKPTWPFLGWGYYSPGLPSACPTGYTAACTAVEGRRGDWEVAFRLTAGETAIGCCPTGYSCTNRNGNTCVAVITPGISTTVHTGTCSGTRIVSSLVAFPDIITATNSASQPVTTQRSAMTLLAPMFQLNYQSSDLETTSSTRTGSSSNTRSSTTSTSTTGAGNNSALGNDNINNNPNNSGGTTGPANNGLSTGTIAGIAVGAALAGILIAAIVACLLIKKRRMDRNNQAPGYDHGSEVANGNDVHTSMYNKPPPVYGSELNNDWTPSEMPNSYEQGGGGRPPEMPAAQQNIAAKWQMQVRVDAAAPVELPAAGYNAPGEPYQAYLPYVDNPTPGYGGQGHHR